MALRIGDPAPDFDLPDQHGHRVRLSSYAGQKAVLVAFYPFAFTGVCTGELNAFRDDLGSFERERSTLVAVSCDPVFSTRALADRDGLFFPLLSDFWPHGEVCQAYGVFDDKMGCAKRSSFVVDRSGRISWQVHSAMGEARDHRAQADALAAASATDDPAATVRSRPE